MGYFVAFLVVNIWAVGHVMARLGVTSILSPLDLWVLRFAVAFVCIIPRLKHFPASIARVGIMPVLLTSITMGSFYILFSLLGVFYLPASKATLVITGAMPLFSVLYGKLFDKHRFRLPVYLGLCGIVFSFVLMFMKDKSNTLTFEAQIYGVLISLMASACYSFSLRLVKKYQFTGHELSLVIIIPTFIIGLIVWCISIILNGRTMLLEYLYTNGFDTKVFRTLFTQGIYQGLLVSILSLYLVSFILKTIGNIQLTYFIAGIPMLTLFYAVMIGEPISLISIIAIIIASIGIFTANWTLSHQKKYRI